MKRHVPVIYNDVDTWLHRRDPRAKILTLVSMMVILYFLPTWEWMLALLFVGVGMSIVARVPKKWLAILLAFQIPQALSFFIIPVVGRAISGQPPLSGSFGFSLKIVLSWPAALFISASIFTSMELTELTDGLRALGVPELAVFTLEYVFLLFYVTISDVFRIIDAMKVKGVEIETKNPIKLARNIPKFGIPIFLSVLKRSTTMMSVLKMRGYSFSGDKELRTEMRYDTGDFVLMLSTAGVLFGTIALRFGYLSVPYLPSG